MCQRWSGAPTVAWVEFPADRVTWNGPGGEPKFYRSSVRTRRGFCPECGSAVCAIDDGSDKIAMTIACFDAPSSIVPGKQHSYKKEVPSWWSVSIVKTEALGT